MKIDIKSIIITLLLVASLFLYYKWHNSENSNYEQELNKLKQENLLIHKKRDSLLSERSILQSDLNLIKNENQRLQLVSEKLEKESLEYRNRANKTKHELDNLRSQLEETHRKIEELKHNPPNRSDDNLLNSLRSKTKNN